MTLPSSEFASIEFTLPAAPAATYNAAMLFRLRHGLTQFSIRDLLWLIVVAAFAACWLRERVAMQQMKADLAAARANDEQVLAKQKAALVRQRQEIERELSLNRREVRVADDLVKSIRKSYDELQEIMNRPGYPDESGRGTYFVAPVR